METKLKEKKMKEKILKEILTNRFFKMGLYDVLGQHTFIDDIKSVKDLSVLTPIIPEPKK